MRLKRNKDRLLAHWQEIKRIDKGPSVTRFLFYNKTVYFVLCKKIGFVHTTEITREMSTKRINNVFVKVRLLFIFVVNLLIVNSQSTHEQQSK